MQLERPSLSGALHHLLQTFKGTVESEERGSRQLETSIILSESTVCYPLLHSSYVLLGQLFTLNLDSAGH